MHVKPKYFFRRINYYAYTEEYLYQNIIIRRAPIPDPSGYMHSSVY